MATISLEHNEWNTPSETVRAVAGKGDLDAAVVAPAYSGKRLGYTMLSLFVLITVIAFVQFSLAGRIATYGYEISHMQTELETLQIELRQKQVAVADMQTLTALDNTAALLVGVALPETTIYLDSTLVEQVAYTGTGY